MSSARGDRGVIQVSKSKALVLLVCDRSHDTIGIPYEESETYRSQDANLSYSDDTDMKNNDSYAPLPTPSGSTGGPGRTQLLPPVSTSGPGAPVFPLSTDGPNSYSHYPTAAHRCDPCNKTFFDEANLRRHLTFAAAHTSTERFLCPVPGCGASFTRRDNLRTHINKAHEGSL